tara:strand:+ start:129 stop:419 length:291 start_codon:yes stop_codon:yes gene_type:complete
MKEEIWRQMQDAATLAAYELMIYGVGDTPANRRDFENAKHFYVQTKERMDRLTYSEGIYYGARAGVAVGALTGFSMSVPMAATGAGIGLAIAHFVD